MKWTPWKKAIAAVLFATAVGIAEATQVYVGSAAQSRGLSFARSLAATVPSWFVLALLLPPTFWLARRFRLDMNGWRYSHALLIHLAASAMFTALHLALSIWLSDHVLTPGPAPQPFFVNLTRLLTVYFVLDTLFYWALVSGYYAFDYSRRYHDAQRVNAELALKESRLETSLSRASLEALRMQLNPHFLFNTLNTISVLAMKGERQRVVRMINRLSDLLRLSLESSRQIITLGEEVDFVQRYLEIEQVRFRDRLRVRVDVPEELLDAEVPSLLLQPLVENAVIHGIGQQLDGGEVEIVGRRRDDRLVLTVSDTGPGFADHQLRNGTGVGLGNTAARLEQLYGTDHVLARNNGAAGGAVVSIQIPYRVLPRELPEEVEWRKSAL